MSALISVEGVTKSFPGGASRSGGSAGATVTALDDVSLEVAEGEVFGIIGRSGAGKTTLLRCLNLLERPTSGRIVFDGTDITALSSEQLRPLRREIGVVFQQFNLLGSRTVRDNIAFPLEIAGMPRAQRAARVDELVELVGLTERAHAYPSQLSGGQMQRVGIARALAAGPRVVLCDEATSALDTETTRQILDLLRRLNETLGVTIVLITHELEVVRRICDSAALLEAGRVVSAGRLEALLADPDSALGEQILPTGGHRAAGSGVGGVTDGHTGAGEGATAVITFTDAVVATPLLSQLTRDLDLDVTLLAGGVEQFVRHDVARLRVRLARPDGSPLDRAQVQRYLDEKGAQVVLS